MRSLQMDLKDFENWQGVMETSRKAAETVNQGFAYGGADLPEVPVTVFGYTFSTAQNGRNALVSV